MKGQTLLGKLFNLIILMVVGSVMVVALFMVTSYVGDVHHFDTTIRVLYRPAVYDTSLMTFLESSDPDSGLLMKDILAAAVTQRSDDYVYVEGRTVNVRQVTGPLLAAILEKPFFLRSTNPELTLGGSASSLGKSSYKTSTQLFKPDSTTCNLELYIGS